MEKQKLDPTFRYAEMGMNQLFENQKRLAANQKVILKMIDGIKEHLAASDRRDLENTQEVIKLLEDLALEIGFRDWDKRDDYLKF
jgi:hypothetical protein